MYFYILHFRTWLHPGFRRIPKRSPSDYMNNWHVSEGQRSHLAVRTGHPLSGKRAASSTGTMRLILGRWSSAWARDYSRALTVMGVMDHKSMLIVDLELLYGKSVKVDFYRRLRDYFLRTKEIIGNFLSDMRTEPWKGVIALRKCLGESVWLLFKGDISEKIKSRRFFRYFRCNLDMFSAAQAHPNSRKQPCHVYQLYDV